MGKKKTIKFEKGVHTINFPILYPKDYRDEVMKVMQLKLPKYRVIGFEARYYQGDKKNPPFDTFKVFIEK